MATVAAYDVPLLPLFQGLSLALRWLRLTTIGECDEDGNFHFCCATLRLVTD